jgi:hypothetical protein
MTNNNTNTPSIGIRAWGTLPKKQNTSFVREDLPRLPYMKLVAGLNYVRIVSGMGVFYQIRWKGPKSKKSYGDKVRTAWPTYGDDCPVKKFLGKEGRERYMVIVIDRADGALKYLDLSQLTAQAIEDILESKNAFNIKKGNNIKVTPRDFDCSIKFDPSSSSATGFYSVNGQEYEPMSEADLALVEAIGGEEVIAKCLNRQLACPKPEFVAKRLTDLGWDGKEVLPEPKKDEKGAQKTKFVEPVEDDYSFNRPADAADAEESEVQPDAEEAAVG